MIKQEVTDLFGEKVVVLFSEARRKPTPRKGYASLPGTGPQGETCKTCANAFKTNIGGKKQFYKCHLMRAHWTGGYGTDILVASPACRQWEKKEC